MRMRAKSALEGRKGYACFSFLPFACLSCTRRSRLLTPNALVVQAKLLLCPFSTFLQDRGSKWRKILVDWRVQVQIAAIKNDIAISVWTLYKLEILTRGCNQKGFSRKRFINRKDFSHFHISAVSLSEMAFWREETCSLVIGGISRRDWLTLADRFWRLNRNVLIKRLWSVQ